jgi:hypothetical protein
MVEATKRNAEEQLFPLELECRFFIGTQLLCLAWLVWSEGVFGSPTGCVASLVNLRKTSFNGSENATRFSEMEFSFSRSVPSFTQYSFLTMGKLISYLQRRVTRIEC